MNQKTYQIVSLGCRTNQYESQAFRDQLGLLGWSENAEEAQLAIVNTCTVTAQADHRSLSQIKKLAAQESVETVAVTGCMAKGAEKMLQAISKKVVVVPNSDKEKLLNLVLNEESLPEFKIKHFEAHTRAFVKVQDGCNSYCSYCVIPFVRGRSRSRPLNDVISEVKGLVESGFKEVVITGINVGDWEEGNLRLHHLIKAVDQVEGIRRVRISSIDPDEVDDELLDIVVNGAHTCPSMHIVLQSGSNVVLQRMRRKYTKQQFLDSVVRLKDARPDFTFTTDVIVGFPGETDEDFAQTLDVVEQVRFAKVHFFPYSPRPKTRAARWELVDKETVNKRKHILAECAERNAFALRQQYVNQKLQVLVEGNNKGHTANFLSVAIEGKTVRSNTLVDVVIEENRPDGLVGKLCE